MPGLTLGIGETNPKRGAVQWDARRIDGVPFVIPSGSGVSTAPIGSIVSLQEDSAGKQIIVLGISAYTGPGSDEYAIIGIGFLEAATQADNLINQTVGSYVDGDLASMIGDTSAVAAVPYDTNNKPAAGGTVYVTPAGTLSSESSGNDLFWGMVWYGTPGIQNSGQLKTGYVYSRITPIIIPLMGG